MDWSEHCSNKKTTQGNSAWILTSLFSKLKAYFLSLQFFVIFTFTVISIILLIKIKFQMTIEIFHPRISDNIVTSILIRTNWINVIGKKVTSE